MQNCGKRSFSLGFPQIPDAYPSTEALTLHLRRAFCFATRSCSCKCRPAITTRAALSEAGSAETESAASPVMHQNGCTHSRCIRSRHAPKKAAFLLAGRHRFLFVKTKRKWGTQRSLRREAAKSLLGRMDIHSLRLMAATAPAAPAANTTLPTAAPWRKLPPLHRRGITGGLYETSRCRRRRPRTRHH